MAADRLTALVARTRRTGLPLPQLYLIWTGAESMSSNYEK